MLPRFPKVIKLESNTARGKAIGEMEIYKVTDQLHINPKAKPFPKISSKYFSMLTVNKIKY